MPLLHNAAIAAEAGTSEESDARKPYVRVCAGSAGNSAFLLREATPDPNTALELCTSNGTFSRCQRTNPCK